MTGQKIIVGTRKSLDVTGYGAYLKLTNGFEHCVYWTKEQVMARAIDKSPSWKKQDKKFSPGSFWDKDFDHMGLKTAMKDLIINHGVISASDKEIIQRYDEENIMEGDLSPAPAMIEDGPIVINSKPSELDNLTALGFAEEPKPAKAQPVQVQPNSMTLEEARARILPSGNTYDNLTTEQLTTIMLTAKLDDARHAAKLIIDWRNSQLAEDVPTVEGIPV